MFGLLAQVLKKHFGASQGRLPPESEVSGHTKVPRGSGTCLADTFVLTRPLLLLSPTH